MKKYFIQTCSFLLFIFYSVSYVAAQKANPERGIERFYVSASSGIVFPIAGEYKNLRIGYNYILKGGWRLKLSSRGGLAWNISYANSQSKIIRTIVDYNYSGGQYNESQDISIKRFDISLLDIFRSYGKNKEGYFHVAINLVFNQNIYKYQGIDYGSSNSSVHTITEKEPYQTGCSFEYGLHCPVSNHFGISIDCATLLIQLKEETTDYITYNTSNTTATGLHGYFNIGLVYGIW